MSIRIAVYTHCQINENPYKSGDSGGLNLKILKMSRGIYETLYTESIADQTDHFADVFVRQILVYSYDIVTTLWSSNVYNRRHFV